RCARAGCQPRGQSQHRWGTPRYTGRSAHSRASTRNQCPACRRAAAQSAASWRGPYRHRMGQSNVFSFTHTDTPRLVDPQSHLNFGRKILAALGIRRSWLRRPFSNISSGRKTAFDYFNHFRIFRCDSNDEAPGVEEVARVELAFDPPHERPIAARLAPDL